MGFRLVACTAKLTVLSACSEETCEQAAVLHYTYNRFEDLKSRRDRCDCAPTEDDAKRCFILPFDRSVSLREQLALCISMWLFVLVQSNSKPLLTHLAIGIIR